MVAFGIGYWEAVGGMGHAEGYWIECAVVREWRT
jgi:hypothetical protein